MVSLHIEPTSKCTLECPLCDRTWFFKTFKKRLLHEIDIDRLVDFVSNDTEIDMCGNNGDPIYHSKFIELCKALKEKNCTIQITTNGSAKTVSWWQELCGVLDKKDQITFSIDGLQDTNHLYRKNCKWSSVMNAVKTVSQNKIKMIWKFIIFKHNQHQINEAKKLSVNLGFANFRLEKSDRWLDAIDFMPDDHNVDKHYLTQQKVLKDKNYTVKMEPYCLVNNKPERALYIDAEGNFYPCCWIGSYRYKYKSIFSPTKNKFNIENTSMKNILQDNKVVNFFNSTKQFTSAHECCKIQCGVKNG